MISKFPSEGMTESALYKPKQQVESIVNSRQHVSTDALRCAVPIHMGGLGGSPEDLSVFMRSLCETSPSSAMLFWAQRMAIEFLVHAENVALREFLLPDFLGSHKSATVAFNFERNELKASNDGRHLFLSGADLVAANAHADCFILICPVRTDEQSIAWCVVDSEVDGFSTLPFDTESFPLVAKVAKIQMQEVFFRGDELLGEASLARKVLEVQSSLKSVFSLLPSDMRQ
jgi:hypothetical protein